MGEKKCFYHFDRAATDKCDSCEKPICGECKQLYQRERRNKTPIKKELCPTCNLNKYSGSVFLVFSISLFMVGLIFSSIYEEAIAFFASLLIFGLFFVIGVIIYQSKMTEKRKKAKLILDKALEARFRDLEKRRLQTEPKGIPGKVITAVYCRFCGAPLPLGENTCDYCGMTWVWE